MQVKSETRVRVNGVLMGKNIGKEVSVVGKVLNNAADRTSFELRTSDNHLITVVLRQPLESNISGVVEVHGVARTKDSLVCNYHIAFPDQLAEDYDPEIVNELAVLINSIPNQWKN